MRIKINYVAVFVMIRQADISENKPLNKQMLQFQEVQLGRDEQWVSRVIVIFLSILKKSREKPKSCVLRKPEGRKTNSHCQLSSSQQLLSCFSLISFIKNRATYKTWTKNQCKHIKGKHKQWKSIFKLEVDSKVLENYRQRNVGWKKSLKTKMALIVKTLVLFIGV